MEQTDFLTINKKCKVPFRPVLICTKAEEDRFNLITVEWIMRTSIAPVMFAVSIAHNRFSYECMQKNRFFNIVYPDISMNKAVEFCGSKSGRDIDKIKELNLEYFKGKLHLPIFKEAVANIELEIVSQIKTGDHTIFVGEAKYYWFDNLKSNLVWYPEV